MSKRQCNFKYGTIGNSECELALSDILTKFNDPYLINHIMRRYYKFKEELTRTSKNVSPYDKKFAERVMDLFKKEAFDGIEKEKVNSNYAIAYSHLRCCMIKLYREAKKKLRK